MNEWASVTASHQVEALIALSHQSYMSNSFQSKHTFSFRESEIPTKLIERGKTTYQEELLKGTLSKREDSYICFQNTLPYKGNKILK